MPNAPSHNEERKCRLCSKDFIAYRYNSFYCSPECSKKRNNQLALDSYYNKKTRLSGKAGKRICAVPDCGTILSRYNKAKICEPCKRKKFITKLTNWGYTQQQAEEHLLIND